MGWTEGQGPYNVSFASIPIQTAWSPFSSPADPWNRNGLAPYGQYFSNLNEYVSASTGFLTVRQTDLTVPGRSLNLEITRVYIEPSTFTGIPMPISYPWAPLGYAWQLNFPWMMNSSAPPFIQLWNGEGYGIPSAFWSGSSGYIENHQGESFSLTRNSTGIFLYTKTGVSYTFDQNNLNRLVKFTDTAGNNTIAFTYTANNWISYITDTTNRVFLFCYSNGLLSRIDQANGSCGSETGFVRRIAYTYSGSSLTNETDPAGRVTSYRYNAVNSGTDAPWLLSRITYPTRWYTNYTYTTVWLGDGSSYSYRIAKQFLATSSGSPVRQNLYSYTQGDGDPIIASTVKSYNATSGQLQLASYTDYAFAFDRVNRTVSDANHSLVRGYQQRFGLHGEVPREIVLVTDGSGGVGSYTNYYGYDLWGNLIYSRSVINPSANWYHESFNAYYNNGLRPGFYAFEETFSRNQGNSPDNPWSVQNGYWLVKNGAYNGTSISGKQESVFAWANISRADVSIQARVFVGKNVTSSDQRIGIFVHYPGTGISKWGLVLHNRTSNGGMYLEFLDEGNQWLPGANSCTIYTNTWYTFNMTIHGYAGTGWAQADGHTTCTTVTGTFSSSSPAALGNGFGLYPGGYSAQFDNVTVATVAPLITGTGFSNSFYANGAPRPNIHSEVAGIAGLSNSTGAIQPIESYFSYMSWGGLNQQKRRYDSPPVQWVTASTTFDGQYGNPKVTVDARGNSTYYAFSGNYTNAYLTNQTMRDGSTKITTLYAYNFTTGNVRIVTDPMGNVTSYQNDNLGRVKKITYPLGGYAQYAYNDQSNYVDITNENGSKTRQIYDGLSRLTVIDRFLSGTSYSNETFTYTWQDRVATRTDPMGSVYRFQYDALGRTVNSTRPDGKSTLQLYNDLSSWIHSKDEDGNFRCNIYDRLERLISVVERADSSCNALFLAGYYYITSYFYDELGRLTKTTTSDYNNISNPSFETGTFSSWTMTGGMIIRTDLFHSGRYAAAPYYDSTSLKYKAFTLQQNFPAPIRADHVSSLALWYLYANSTVDSIQVLYSDGSYTSTFLPHVVSWTLINAAFDKSKQITGIKVVRTTGVGWNIVMDDVLVSLAETRSYSYDNLNRLKSSSYPDSRSESYVYDNNGNLVQSFDRMNVKTLYSYDSVNRLKTVTFCGATTIIGTSYTYDKNGNLLQMKNENATVTYIYDARNRVLNETSAVNLASRQVVDLGCFGPWGTLTRNGGVSKTYTVGFTYKGEFLDTLMYPTISQLNPDITIKYAYDTLGRVLNVTRLGASTYYARSFTYYKNDQVKGLQFGNGLIGNYTYDNLSRPSTITLSGATTMSLTYSYNNTGTVATVVGTVNLVTVNEQYRHDALQRLTNYTITSSGSATSGWYEYDNVGNRVRQKLNSTITSYAYNSISQLTNSTAYTTPQTKITYGYDLTGNLKTQNVTTTGTVRWTYTWDAANRLLKATNGTGQALYAYDGVGRMVEAVEGASTWFLAYRGTEIMYRNLLNMNNQAYVFAGGLKIARVVDRTAMYYYHTDALGSTRMITYNDATYVFTDNYQPFGKDNGTPKGNLANTEKDRFTGKPVSATTGLYYEYQRWYDPSIGRFISQDPLAGHLSNPQSLNPYVYVTDTPTSSTDPTGMDGGFGSDHRREQCDRDHTLSWCKPLTKEAVEVNVKVMWIFLGVEAAIGIAFVCVVACPAIAASLAIGGPAACEEGGCEDLAGLGTQGLVNTADFFENVGADSTASAVARLAAGQASHVSLVNDIVQLYGEAPNTGPGQLRVTNQLGTYIPDFLSGSEAKSVTYLSRTSQMQIAIQNAIDTGTRFTLYTRPYTELSDPLQGYVDRLIIELIRVPFLS
ncbi:hypothetical protein E6H36_07680 [Candidatus Bathyarchaeota archaeon]|nr:MAG: hypothetical protein E6H36_07680 [Candidatus Bathyarchaeota archaeon]